MKKIFFISIGTICLFSFVFLMSSIGNAAKINSENISAIDKSLSNSHCAKKGEKVNRNPLLGLTNQKCCFPLKEIRVSRSYSICQK